MSIRTRRRALLALVTASAVGAAGFAAAGQAAAPQVKRLRADTTQFRFSVKRLSANAGQVQLVLTNPSLIPHNISLSGKGIRTVSGRTVARSQAGGISKITVRLKKGAYTFFCSVPGHASGGMKGTLTVR